MFALLSFAAVSLIRRNRRRSILTTLAVASATLVLCAVMMLPYVTDRIAASADTSPRVVVMNKSAMRYGLPESYSQKVQNIPDVVAVNRMTWFGGIYDDPRHQFSTVAVDPQTIDLMWPEDGFDPAVVSEFKEYRDAAIVGSALMHRFGWKVGQNVILKSQIYPVTLSFRILGSYSGGINPNVFMFRRDYLEEAMHDATRVDMMWVRCSSSSITSRIAGQIDSTFHNSSAETETDTEKQFLVTFLVRFQSIGHLVQAVGLCAVFAIALAVLNACSMTLRERRSEIAVMRTVGFSSSQILTAFVAEALVIAIAGGILGASISALMVDLARGAIPALGAELSSGMPYPIVFSGIAMALVIGAIASLASTLSALRSPVSQALREVT
ncbi:MAG TPA: ABC transporter permease [Candidatus Binataceae bacterium]|nr:ABC transporter permease [Candidatus Binataceae bacterium]